MQPYLHRQPQVRKDDRNTVPITILQFHSNSVIPIQPEKKIVLYQYLLADSLYKRPIHQLYKTTSSKHHNIGAELMVDIKMEAKLQSPVDMTRRKLTNYQHKFDQYQLIFWLFLLLLDLPHLFRLMMMMMNILLQYNTETCVMLIHMSDTTYFYIIICFIYFYHYCNFMYFLVFYVFVYFFLCTCVLFCTCVLLCTFVLLYIF